MLTEVYLAVQLSVRAVLVASGTMNLYYNLEKWEVKIFSGCGDMTCQKSRNLPY